MDHEQDLLERKLREVVDPLTEEASSGTAKSSSSSSHSSARIADDKTGRDIIEALSVPTLSPDELKAMQNEQLRQIQKVRDIFRE